ncbi:hypothetical protein Desdi_1681 [Desulfitobacterium dichloroeliminans LMG P-21439]|uniref:DUF1287 domain-containing protein n=1 Tax=Desulfitobacterium dichloroeliminans (strain LMG P-21439 / DCA1) TaxID=871963 RepID=L0F815_DESDL|nr:DUF1287 domain-containing protein [Desulfitobacterium dichloroeliminans]AGA69170.1 hypothetical protein Desdi_1681 [Desulfitobacterium dichloroeliminans LMG P-21439]
MCLIKYRKSLVLGATLSIFTILISSGCSRDSSNEIKYLEPQLYIQVPTIECPVDIDLDGINDLKDIVKGAKDEVSRRPRYRDNYYAGGYPPRNEGVCTDVIWRAFKDAGYDLKENVDEDIQQNISLYPRVDGVREPNIDFRRVQNLFVYFQRYGQALTTKVIPGDVDNLTEWQPGDIVTFGDPYEHIAIISDRRRPDGVPYLLHNGGPVASEEDRLLSWQSPITGHFRFPKF